MSKTQDYIAKIRYQNDLPPPLLPPKLLNYNISPNEEIGSKSLLSSLYRKENINNLISIDDDLGTPIDLISVPEGFESVLEDDSNRKEQEQTKLHPNDRILLRDPGIDRTVKNQPNVSFLRRTEYIGSNKTVHSSANVSRSVTPATSTRDLNAEQLKKIEDTFTNATNTLTNPEELKHPLKRHLRAKKVYSLLPDISRMDQDFTSIRLSTNNLKDDKDGVDNLQYSLLRKLKLGQLNWVQFFKPSSKEDLTKIKKELKDLKETKNDAENLIDEEYSYTKKGEFELNYIKFNNEIALQFDTDNELVYYNSIKVKGDLKKRKLLESHTDIYNSLNYDEVNVKYREPTVDELNERNNKRHKYDDVTYESTERSSNDEDVYEEKGDEDDLEEIRKRNLED